MTEPALPPDIARHPITLALEACADKPLTLGALLREVADRHADRQAIAFRGQSVSYRELRRRAVAVAKALVAAGYGKGSRVGVLLSSRPEFVAAAYGITMIGGVAVLLHSVATARERDYMLMHSDCALFMLQAKLHRNDWLGELADLHPELRSERSGVLQVNGLPALRRVVCLDETRGLAGIESWENFLAEGAAIPDSLIDALAAQVHPSDDAVVIYSSGSTGSPKAVLHRHRAACLQQWRGVVIHRVAEAERVWSMNPIFWSAGFAFFMGTLAGGACLVMQERADPAEALELIEREKVTMLFSPVATINPMTDHPDAATRDLSSIRWLPTNASLRQRLPAREKWAPTVFWGMSETFATCTYQVPEDEPMADPGGYPMPGMRIRVIDPQTGEPLPRGRKGELQIAGMQVMRGYYRKDPEECFDADGFARTGDEGYIDERGRVHFTARLANMIKTKGANVSPVEVEDAIARWGRVKFSCVVGVPNAERGEDVVACVVPQDDIAVTAEEIVAHLRKDLASYKVPRHVVFIRMDEIPMTASNKPKLGEMKRIAAERLGITA